MAFLRQAIHEHPMQPAVICYSLALTRPDHRCVNEFVQSVRSLREHNRTIPAVLFLYGVESDVLLREADRQSIQVVRLGDFEASMRHPMAHVLALYPFWHKLPSLRHAPPAERLLYIDCDTFWFDDPERLLAAHSEADWYARDEVYSRRGYPLEYDPHYLDEDKFRLITESLGATWFPPFNTGVILAKRWVIDEILKLDIEFLDIGWRLLVGEMLQPGPRYIKDDAMSEAVRAFATVDDLNDHIPFPCSNRWVVEEAATWLILGLVPGVRVEPLDPDMVLQSNGFLWRGPKAVLAHYLNRNGKTFFENVPPLP
jgi:hypothetical protein